ncbi:MAG: Bifunctional protein HldE [Pyrinomonadaceae bacterium]|nr:Bifunctional protein HldE [Pyrinomonadaceae bacterium]
MTRSTDILLKDFAAKKIAVIGDLVADQYLSGSIARVSREAPVFILRHNETSTLPGAAANTAANIAALGAAVLAVGVVGEDVNGDALLDALSNANVPTGSIQRVSNWNTPTKVRVLAGHQHAIHQQVIRIDYEPQKELDPPSADRLINAATKACESADAVIISDYNYGTATPNLFAAVKHAVAARGIPLVVDSRFRLGEFAGATSATPNQDEVDQLVDDGESVEQLEELCRRLEFNSLLVTRGNNGMLVVRPGERAVEIAAVGSLDAVDVTGAGDTVTAAYALGLACGFDEVDAARLANHAGGLVVMKRGTAVVTADELAASIAADLPKAVPAK